MPRHGTEFFRGRKLKFNKLLKIILEANLTPCSFLTQGVWWQWWPQTICTCR